MVSQFLLFGKNTVKILLKNVVTIRKQLLQYDEVIIVAVKHLQEQVCRKL